MQATTLSFEKIFVHFRETENIGIFGSIIASTLSKTCSSLTRYFAMS